MSDYGNRANGSKKGEGYFGPVHARDGKSFATEIGVNEDVDGEDFHYPLIHPEMSRKDLDHLVNGGKPTPEMYDRALAHAKKRKSEGKSPFADADERHPLPDDDKDLEEGFRKVRGE